MRAERALPDVKVLQGPLSVHPTPLHSRNQGGACFLSGRTDRRRSDGQPRAAGCGLVREEHSRTRVKENPKFTEPQAPGTTRGLLPPPGGQGKSPAASEGNPVQGSLLPSRTPPAPSNLQERSPGSGRRGDLTEAALSPRPGAGGEGGQRAGRGRGAPGPSSPRGSHNLGGRRRPATFPAVPGRGSEVPGTSPAGGPCATHLEAAAPRSGLAALPGPPRRPQAAEPARRGREGARGRGGGAARGAARGARPGAPRPRVRGGGAQPPARPRPSKAHTRVRDRASQGRPSAPRASRPPYPWLRRGAPRPAAAAAAAPGAGAAAWVSPAQSCPQIIHTRATRRLFAVGPSPPGLGRAARGARESPAGRASRGEQGPRSGRASTPPAGLRARLAWLR